MKRFFNIISIFLLILVIFSYVDETMGLKYEGKKIKTVIVKGIKNIDDAIIYDALTFREGDKLISRELSNSIKNIYQTAKFSDVKADIVEKDNQLIVTIIVLERPVIKEIVFKGNDEYGETDLSEAIEDYIDLDEVLDEYRLNEAVNIILHKYEQDGIRDTTVRTFKIVDHKEKTCKIIFRIKEGDEIRVVKIKINGTKVFEENKIISEMETHIDDWLHSGIFNRDEYEMDKRIIIRFYRNHGYIKAKILGDKLKYRIEGDKRDKEKKLYIIINISEGKQYKFGRYTISGNTLFMEEELMDLLELETGETFNQDEFEEDIIRAQMLYNGRGYIFASIVPVQEINEEMKVVNYKININEGEIAHVENIILKGNTKTRDYVILRELLVREGEMFNARKIRRSQEKIYNLGFFKDVKVTPQYGSAQGLMNLIIQVEEQMTGLITLGLVYGTVDGLGGYEEISENNFLGRGIRVHERIEYQENRQNYEVGMSYPWIFGSPMTFSFSLFFRTREELRTPSYATNLAGEYQMMDYKKQEIGGTLGLARRMSDTMTITAIYGFEIYKYYNYKQDREYADLAPGEANALQSIKPISSWLQGVEGVNQIKSSLTFRFDYDSRDNIFNPTRGTHFNQSVSIVGGPLGGDDKYLKYITDYSKYFPLFWKFVLVLHGNLGVIDRSFDAKPVKISTDDLLYVGGVESVRGYDYWEPWWLSGGKSRLYANMEYRFPIAEQLLWGVLFLDGGHVWEKTHLINLNLREFYYSVGWGFRIQIPMIPIRLYFSKRFGYDKGYQGWGKGWSFHKDSRGFGGWEFDFSVGGLF